MLKQTMKGAAIASAVAGMLAAGAVTVAHASDAPKSVKCLGINECKGKGSCHGAGNSCAGQNACKGKGWVEVKDEKACTDKGGKILK